MIDQIRECPCCKIWKHIRNFNYSYSDSSHETLKKICTVCQYNSKQIGNAASISQIVSVYKKLKCAAKAAHSLSIPYLAVKEALRLRGISPLKGEKPLKDWNSLNFKDQWEIVTRIKSNQL